MNLPSGIVTFLFTDIEGSSRLWEQHPQAMREVVARHDSLLKAAVVENNGYLVKMRGDGLHAVFESVQDGVAAAVAGQRALQAEVWDSKIDRLVVRMGLHSGTAQLRDEDYFGPTVNRAARLQDAGHGGQILLSQVSSGLLGSQLPAGISLLDLGRHLIKDFPAAERVYQVTAVDLPSRFPPLRAAGGQRTNLPTQATSFVGRERQMKAAEQLLEQDRLVTLTGPGGTGKTRLSLQVAERVSGGYRDGVWLIELAPLTEASMVLPAIIKVFSLQPEPRRLPETVLADFLRGKQMLLLLDNCEHLIETCAQLASELLDGASGLKILASSREALGVPGEMILRVPSLKLPASDAPAEILKQSEAVQLFSDRGRAVRPDFQVTNTNAAAIAEICRRLDGIPLAIELAASRLRLFSAPQLASRLNDRFRLLTGGSRTALPRQQTLQALIDWSYDLLSDEEQELFRRLSVFAGGWTFDAAEALCEGLDVLDLLDQLVNKSLVQAEQTEYGFRFRYLETLRQYARDRLYSEGDGVGVRDLHFAYFARLAASAIREFGGPRNDEMRQLMSPEIDNFRQAMEWGLGGDPIAALDFLVHLVSFFAQDASWMGYAALADDVHGWLENASEHLAALTPDEASEVQRKRAWARIHSMQALILIQKGDFGRIQGETEKAILLAREVGDQSTLMVSLGLFALAAVIRLTDEQEAVQAAEECLLLASQRKNPYYTSIALLALAGHEVLQGNIAAGEAFLIDSAKGGGLIGALALLQGGRLLTYRANDPAKGLSYFQDGRHRFMVLENDHMVAASNSQIAHIQRLMGDFDAAEEAYRATLAHFGKMGHRPAIAHELECLGFIAQARKLPKRAARLFGAADALRGTIKATMLPHEQEEYDRALVELKREMNAGAFQEAWTAGAVMEIDQAIDYALAGPILNEDSQ